MTLRGLIDAVGEGTFLMDVLSPEHELTAYDAFSGSLDAAKRLHDALLPGWIWNIVDDSATIWRGPPDDPMDGLQETYLEGMPARAWLLAILRALESDARAGGGE